MCKVWSGSIGKDHARGVQFILDTEQVWTETFVPQHGGEMPTLTHSWQGINHSLILTCSLVSLEYTQE